MKQIGLNRKVYELLLAHVAEGTIAHEALEKAIPTGIWSEPPADPEARVDFTVDCDEEICEEFLQTAKQHFPAQTRWLRVAVAEVRS